MRKILKIIHVTNVIETTHDMDGTHQHIKPIEEVQFLDSFPDTFKNADRKKR